MTHQYKLNINILLLLLSFTIYASEVSDQQLNDLLGTGCITNTEIITLQETDKDFFVVQFKFNKTSEDSATALYDTVFLGITPNGDEDDESDNGIAIRALPFDSLFPITTDSYPFYMKSTTKSSAYWYMDLHSNNDFWTLVFNSTAASYSSCTVSMVAAKTPEQKYKISIKDTDDTYVSFSNPENLTSPVFKYEIGEDAQDSFTFDLSNSTTYKITVTETTDALTIPETGETDPNDNTATVNFSHDGWIPIPINNQLYDYTDVSDTDDLTLSTFISTYHPILFENNVPVAITNVESIKQGEVYWIYSSNDDSKNLVYKKATTDNYLSIDDLSTGWHFIAPAAYAEFASVEDLENSDCYINNEISSIFWTFNIEKQKYKRYTLSDTDPLPTNLFIYKN